MTPLNITKLLFIALIYLPIFGFSQVLTNNTSISITKTWTSQPSGYTYPINILVPQGAVPQGGFPVCILLHGNGSANLSILAGPNSNLALYILAIYLWLQQDFKIVGIFALKTAMPLT